MNLNVLLLGFLLLVISPKPTAKMSEKNQTETYPYTVIKEYDVFEIRKYEETLFTSVKLSSNEYKNASRKGFSILAGYIFGGNDRDEKIAMTTPVSMSLEDSMTMMFMVPKKFNKETLPEPKEKQIQFREEPAKIVAAITFGGWANEDKIEKNKLKLIAALKAEGIEFSNKFYLFAYNAPFELFNRRNEIIVELIGEDARR